jgi:exopolysaccharide biosynthesis predicted pyruvyltransferase EpsI
MLRRKKSPHLPVRQGIRILKDTSAHYASCIVNNSRKILNAYRTDIESTNISKPSDNIDVSETFKLGMDPDLALLSSVGLLRYIDKFEVINTNRLHGCIAGLLMNKRVNFYPNNYYKNEAVYNHSIKGAFKNVSWSG